MKNIFSFLGLACIYVSCTSSDSSEKYFAEIELLNKQIELQKEYFALLEPKTYNTEWDFKFANSISNQSNLIVASIYNDSFSPDSLYKWISNINDMLGTKLSLIEHSSYEKERLVLTIKIYEAFAINNIVNSYRDSFYQFRKSGVFLFPHKDTISMHDTFVADVQMLYKNDDYFTYVIFDNDTIIVEDENCSRTIRIKPKNVGINNITYKIASYYPTKKAELLVSDDFNYQFFVRN